MADIKLTRERDEINAYSNEPSNTVISTSSVGEYDFALEMLEHIGWISE